ncbi:MAG: hypothetical protein AAF654_06025 [Myxococcota bacterium]
MRVASRRVGFELELVAPNGADRGSIARAMCPPGGYVIRGFSRHDLSKAAGTLVLTPAHHVYTKDDEWLASVVDDLSVHGPVTAVQARSKEPQLLAVDPSVARSLELLALGETLDTALDCWSQQLGLEQRLLDQGDAYVDQSGRAYALRLPYSRERTRVAEIVLAPCLRDDAEDRLSGLLEGCRKIGLQAPKDGALHVHLDAQPWQSTAALKALILRYHHRREDILGELGITGEGPYRGNFSSELVVAAAHADPSWSFEVTREWFLSFGPSKAIDVNLMGVLGVDDAPPTLELRMLPATVDTEWAWPRVEALTELFEAFTCDWPQEPATHLHGVVRGAQHGQPDTHR